MREVPEGVPAHGHDAGVGGGDGAEQLVDRRPAVADPNSAVEIQLARQARQLGPEGPVSVDLEPQARDLLACDRDGTQERVMPVAALDGAVADQCERLGPACRGRVPADVEDGFVGGVEHDLDLLLGRPARDERLPHLVGARDHVVGEADARLLGGRDESHSRVARGHAELDAEEFRHALVEVEQDARTEQPRDGRREDERIRHRVHLHDVPAPPLVQHRRGEAGREPEGGVLEQVARPAFDALVAERQAMDGHGAKPLAARLPRPADADHVDLVARRRERVDLPAHAGVERVVALPDHGNARH